MTNLKTPIPVKSIIVLLSANFLYLTGIAAYLFYLAYLAEMGSLSDWQSKFLQGAGFNSESYSYSDHAAYTGAIALPILFSFINMLLAIFKKPNMLMASLLISWFIFKAASIGLGIFTGFISFILLLVPSSSRYFKELKAVKSEKNAENA